MKMKKHKVCSPNPSVSPEQTLSQFPAEERRNGQHLTFYIADAEEVWYERLQNAASDKVPGLNDMSWS